MQALKQHINSLSPTTIGEVRVMKLYPDGELVMPINQLVLPKEFTCKLKDILQLCSKIESKEPMEPIIINDTNLIIDGKKRYFAFKRLGYKKVRVVKQQTNRYDLNGNDFSIITDIN